MNRTENQIADWTYRLLGLKYIEEKLGKSLDKDEEFKKDIQKLKRITVRNLKKCYDSLKNDESFRKHPLFEIFQKAFDETENDDIREAKELLKRHGFKVSKKSA